MRIVFGTSRLGMVAACAVWAAAACAPAAQSVYVAATPETIHSRLEVAPTGRAQYVVVENRSSQEIFVTGVHLRNCRNVKNACEVTPMRTAIPPGQSRRVLTVQVETQNQPSAFGYGTSWEVAAPVIPVIR
jgi:hypothetical protein